MAAIGKGFGCRPGASRSVRDETLASASRKTPPMSCCDLLAGECPLDLTEGDCRMLIGLLRHVIIPEREPRLPRREPLRVILETLEFAVGR